MEYIYGTEKDQEILKTKGTSHTDLVGYHEVVREYQDQKITDSFHIVKRYDSKEDEEGNCYDWYIIDHHYRYTDKTVPLKEQIEAITPFTGTKKAYIGDTSVTFSGTPKGNVTVFFDEPYTLERVGDKITISFDELKEVKEVTISIL